MQRHVQIFMRVIIKKTDWERIPELVFTTNITCKAMFPYNNFTIRELISPLPFYLFIQSPIVFFDVTRLNNLNYRLWKMKVKQYS